MLLVMARKARVAPGGWAYHVLNRSVGKMEMFRKDKDYAAFERVIAEAADRHPMRILSYCVMPTHWHFVVWPEADGQLSAFFRWLTLTHAVRWRVSRRTVGYGHLYQGRFKSFPIQRDEHLLTVCRYVERNPLTAGRVERAGDWQWGSLWARDHAAAPVGKLLARWPVERRRDWVDHVNEPLTAKEIERMALSLKRGRPFGDDRWVIGTAAKLNLEYSLRPEGRPRIAPPANPQFRAGRSGS
jgi:putative transposase